MNTTCEESLNTNDNVVTMFFLRLNTTWQEGLSINVVITFFLRMNTTWQESLNSIVINNIKQLA